MKRDFSGESAVNTIMRAMRAFGCRARGRFYSYLNAFAPGSSKRVAFGANPKFMNSKKIHLGNNVSFGNLCRLECYSSGAYPAGDRPKISIGENCSFGDFNHIGAVNEVTIGRNLLCASKVLIIDHDHGRCGSELKNHAAVPPTQRELVSKGPIRIGDNVWIAESVVILAGADIGDGAVIGANSVVRGVVPPGTVHTSKS